MIEPGHPKLSLSRQCHLLRVSQSSLYHRLKGERAENLALMRRIGVDRYGQHQGFSGGRTGIRRLPRGHAGRLAEGGGLIWRH